MQVNTSMQLHMCLRFLQIPPSIASPADSIDSVKLMSNAANFAPRADDWSFASRIAVASVTSQGTGGLIVAGFVRISISTIHLLLYMRRETEETFSGSITLSSISAVKNDRLEINSGNLYYLRYFISL